MDDRDLLYACVDAISDGNDAVLLMELLDDSDDDIEPSPKKGWGGSKPGKMPNQDCKHLQYNKLFCKKYWGLEATANTPAMPPPHTSMQFQRRFCMPMVRFEQLLVDVPLVDPWFVQKRDAFGKLGISCCLKIAVAVRMLATGNSAEKMDN